MPRGVKAERPMSAEPVESIQTSTIVILHPGSTTMWLGRATDYVPRSITHAIAWRKPAQFTEEIPDETLLTRPGIDHPDCETQRELALSVVEQAIWSRKTSRKHHVSANQVSTYNSSVKPEIIDDESSIKWTDVSTQPRFVIGEAALYIDPKEPYAVHWPFKKGHLNLHDGPGGSLTAVCADLEVLWAHAIQTILDIPLRDLGYYRAVLVVPDTFDTIHTKEMTNILLCRLGFSSVIIHQESVCTTFGCGLSSACVVDVGDEKTSICCVEEGVVIPSTRLWLQYGGRDITRCFYWLLKRVNFPYKECDLANRLDTLLLHELKETFCHLSQVWWACRIPFCHLSQDIVSGRVHEFQVHRPLKTPASYQLKIGDEAIQAPMAMFFPQLFGIVGERLVRSPEQQYDDPEDLLNDKYLLESLRGDQSSKGKSGATADAASAEGDQEMSATTVAHKKHKRMLHSTAEKSLGLEQAILYSIECCASDDSKRKMYNNVLLVGGGFMFTGGAAMLQSRLQAKLPQALRKLVDQVEVIARPKEMDPRTICWKGGAVLSILDTAQELWLSQKEWLTMGPRALRERSPFIWPAPS